MGWASPLLARPLGPIGIGVTAFRVGGSIPAGAQGGTIHTQIGAVPPGAGVNHYRARYTSIRASPTYPESRFTPSQAEKQLSRVPDHEYIPGLLIAATILCQLCH